ncbi:MAG: hypothetical protein JWO56_3455, partial [Acidobacteria bacterium]|nr:hypothetical protein [Acidobacteriota bacterium]
MIMRTFTVAALFAAAALTACCTTSTTGAAAVAPPAAAPAPPAAKSAADLVDHLGDSTGTAVPVPSNVPFEGVDWQKKWIYDHFGRFRQQKFAMGHAPGSAGHERRYDIITFEVPDGSVHTVYFDMTEFWEQKA